MQIVMLKGVMICTPRQDCLRKVVICSRPTKTNICASGLVACDRRHLWVDVKSDLRAPVAYTFV